MADDDSTTQDDTGTDQNTDAGQDTWTPPTKEEWEKTQKSLAKANQMAQQRREALQALQQQSEGDTDKVVREAREEERRKLKPVAVREAAKAAFLESGCNPERVAKLTKQLDLDALEIDDEGQVFGLAEQVATVKADFPELFGTEKQRPPRVTTSDRPGTNGRELSFGEKVAAQVFGR